MERRRAIGPKRTKNTPALVKAVILAAAYVLRHCELLMFLAFSVSSDRQNRRKSLFLGYRV